MAITELWQSALFTGGMQGIYGFLLIASIVTAMLTRGGRRQSLRPRVYAWWLMLPLIHAALLFKSTGLLLLIALIAILAFRDLFRISQQRFRFVFVAACLLLMAAAIVLSDAIPQAVQIALLMLLPVVFLWRSDRHIVSSHQHSLLFAWAGCCSGLACLYLLLPATGDAPEQQMRWLFFLMVMTCFNDVAQFISGSNFGKQRIAASISPNKTWQGVAGGVLVSSLLATFFGNYLALAPLLLLALLGAVLSVCGLLGDLWFSMIKRRLQIKDFSNLIPGHGGILDRADSLMLTAPAMLIFLNIWNTH